MGIGGKASLAIADIEDASILGFGTGAPLRPRRPFHR